MTSWAWREVCGGSENGDQVPASGASRSNRPRYSTGSPQRNIGSNLALLLADGPRVAQHPQFGDVAAEQERDRPVRDDAQLAGHERKLVQVVRSRDEPAGEAAQAQAKDVGDPAVAAERRHLSEHAIAVGLGVAAQVPGEASGLAERVLRGRRIRVFGRRSIGDARAVAERPDVLVALDAHELVDLDAAAIVER